MGLCLTPVTEKNMNRNFIFEIHDFCSQYASVCLEFCIGSPRFRNVLQCLLALKRGGGVLPEWTRFLKKWLVTLCGTLNCPTSPLYDPGAYQMLTSRGREQLREVAEEARRSGRAVVWGDSVSADSPILIKSGAVAHLATIDRVTVGDYAFCNGSFCRVDNVIRHRCEKTMYRVVTTLGYLDVTADHSLLRQSGDPVRPEELMLNDVLLSNLAPAKDVRSRHHLVQSHVSLDAIASFYSGPYDKLHFELINWRASMDSRMLDVVAWLDRQSVRFVPLVDHASVVRVSVTHRPCASEVFDLQTKRRCFNVGRVVAHNTDSIVYAVPKQMVADPAEFSRRFTASRSHIVLRHDATASVFLVVDKKACMYLTREGKWVHKSLININSNSTDHAIMKAVEEICRGGGSLGDVQKLLCNCRGATKGFITRIRKCISTTETTETTARPVLPAGLPAHLSADHVRLLRRRHPDIGPYLPIEGSISLEDLGRRIAGGDCV